MDQDLLKRAGDFETQFNSWFSSSFKPLIDDSRKRYRMVLSDAKERKDRGLSALPSTKTVEVVDKAKENALIEYHKDIKGISYTALSKQLPEIDQLYQWLTAVVHYRMDSPNGFPFFAWHDSSLKAGYTDGLEAAFVYWRKEAYKVKRTVFTDIRQGTEIPEEAYNQVQSMWPSLQAQNPLIPPFETAFSKKTVEEPVVCKDTWWIDQLKPGENVLWDFKAPMLDVNQGEICMVKIRKSVDQIMALVDAGVFDKIKREEVEQSRSLETTTHSAASDPTAIDKTVKSANLGDHNRVEIWILWEKVNFRWMVSFSIDGKKLLTKERKPSDDIFFNGRKLNRLPVVIGYFDKALHENIPRSIPQVIAPIEDQYIDHINNVNDIAKNIARGGRIRLTPGNDINVDEVLNGGVFTAEKDDVEFIQYNPGVMEGMRASDMHSAAMSAVAPAGVSAVNIAPKGTNKTLGVSQMIQGTTDAKRYVQLMLRNQTFFKPLMWLIAQLEFAYETDDTVLKIAAAQVPGFKPPVTIMNGKEVIDVSVLDFDVNVQINAGLNEMPDTEKFNNMMQFATFCKQVGIMLDPMVLGQIGASLAGYSFERFNPQSPLSNIPPPKLENKLTVAANFVELPPDVQQMLVETWTNGESSTDSKVEGRMNEMMHNMNPNPASASTPDMTQGSAALGQSRGGMIGGASGN